MSPSPLPSLLASASVESDGGRGTGARQTQTPPFRTSPNRPSIAEPDHAGKTQVRPCQPAWTTAARGWGARGTRTPERRSQPSAAVGGAAGGAGHSPMLTPGSASPLFCCRSRTRNVRRPQSWRSAPAAAAAAGSQSRAVTRACVASGSPAMPHLTAAAARAQGQPFSLCLRRSLDVGGGDVGRTKGRRLEEDLVRLLQPAGRRLHPTLLRQPRRRRVRLAARDAADDLRGESLRQHRRGVGVGTESLERGDELAEMRGDGEVERGIEQRQHRLARRAQPPAPPVLRVVLEQPLQPPRQPEPRCVRRPESCTTGISRAFCGTPVGSLE